MCKLSVSDARNEPGGSGAIDVAGSQVGHRAVGAALRDAEERAARRRRFAHRPRDAQRHAVVTTAVLRDDVDAADETFDEGARHSRDPLRRDVAVVEGAALRTEAHEHGQARAVHLPLAVGELGVDSALGQTATGGGQRGDVSEDALLHRGVVARTHVTDELVVDARRRQLRGDAGHHAVGFGAPVRLTDDLVAGRNLEGRNEHGAVELERDDCEVDLGLLRRRANNSSNGSSALGNGRR